ncbi:MAG: hypothetical protein ACOY3D_07380 [Candidatus Omnitrophota bacterium]
MSRNRFKESRNAVTLVELVMAVLLLGLVMISAANVDIASRKFFIATDKEGQLQVRLGAALEHMAKNITLAHGDTVDPGINIVGTGSIEIRLDNGTPQSYTDDVWMRYWQDGEAIRYCVLGGGACVGAVETICRSNVDVLQFTLNSTYPALYVDIVLAGSDVDIAPVTLQTRVFPRSISNN